MMRKPTSLATALIMLALLFALVPLLPQPAQAHPGPWWNSNWQYRMLINITENSGSTLTNYQVPITLTTITFNYSKSNASGNDIRFATDGTECDYWIETWNTSGQSKLWVEVPSLPALSTTTIYMYYGNSGASAASNGNNTFDFFDDFSGDLSKWTIDSENTDKVYIDNGALRHDPDSSQTKNSYYDTRIRTADYKILDGVIEYLVYLAGSTSNSPRIIHQLGFRVNSLNFTNGYCWRMQNSATDGGHLEFTNGAWAPFGTAFPAIAGNIWHTVKEIVSDSTYTGYVDGGIAYSGTDSTKLTADYLISHVHGVDLTADSYVLVDNVRVRKYASPEPSVNLGQEESSAPTVGTITISPGSMTPQEQWTNTTVPVTDNNTLANVNKVNVTVFYDSAGNDTSAPGTADVQTCAILTWTRGGSPVWSLAPASTTWAINTGGCSNASDSLTTGNWVFSFKVGKVATHSPGSDDWDIYAKATDSIGQTGDNYLRDVEMNWYGEINVTTGNISWGTVTPGCSNNISPVVNITYICNGNYDEQVKTPQNWTNASGNVALNTTGNPGTGEFSLKADDDATLVDAVQVLSASYTTFDTGTQTTEAGNPENNNHLWLSLGSGIPVDTYSGTIYFGITQ